MTALLCRFGTRIAVRVLEHQARDQTGERLACPRRQRPPFRHLGLTVIGAVSEQVELGWSGRRS
jgi:hypothetical protein